MSDVIPPSPTGPPDWNAIIYFFFITLITVGAEYARRIMPAPKMNRRKTDKKQEDREESSDE